MIDLREIRETIDEIKRNGTTVGQAEKLALLYIAAQHMEQEEAERMQRNPEKMERGYSRAAAPESRTAYVQVEPRSRFLEACNGAKVTDVLGVMNEHMEAIMVLYPKEYEAIIARIKKPTN